MFASLLFMPKRLFSLMTHGTNGIDATRHKRPRRDRRIIQMRAALIIITLCAATLAGCGHAEQQRQAREYEHFLKESLGTVANDPPTEALAHLADHAI
jgi:hypothetical protein